MTSERHAAGNRSVWTLRLVNLVAHDREVCKRRIQHVVPEGGLPCNTNQRIEPNASRSGNSEWNAR
jgi:hypothetical protein